MIFIPTERTYSPLEEELWPIVYLAIQKVLKQYPEVNNQVLDTVDQALAAFRGHRNPFPANLIPP